MIPEAMIAAVDNDPDDLTDIRAGLDALRMPSLMLYYNDENEMPNLPGIRLLFLDLNLVGQGDLNPSIIAGPLINVLEEINPQGPYAIIFWTKYADQAHAVFDTIKGRIQNYPHSPVGWNYLDKEEFKSQGSQVASNPTEITRLKKKISRIMSDLPMLHALMGWETRISSSARKTLEGLDHLVCQEGGIWNIEKKCNSLKQLFACLGTKAVGQANLDAGWRRAIEEGLLPLLKDNLSALETDDSYSQAWEKILQEHGNADALPNGIHSASLNAHLFIEENESIKNNDRGVFLQFPRSKEEKYLRQLFGLSRTSLLYEFINLDKKDINENSELRDLAIHETLLGLVNIDAECDHAQGKLPVHQYVLSALVLENVHKAGTFKNKSPARSPFTIVIESSFKYQNQSYVLKVSPKHKVSLKRETIPSNNPIFRIRRQLINKIAHDCLEYHNRPGYIFFP